MKTAVFHQENNRIIGKDSRGEFYVEETMKAGVTRTRRVASLERWFHSGKITSSQYAAGNRLLDEYDAAFIEPRYALSDYGERVDGSPDHKDQPISRITAHKVYQTSLAAMNGIERRYVVEFVCRGLPVSRQVENKERGKVSGIIYSGLTTLAEYYRY